MALEIERKFLVDAEKIAELDLLNGEKIVQGYLSIIPEKTVRVRTKNNHAYLTIKTKNIGIVRSEFEYEIPLADAQELLKLCPPYIIEKTRYKIEFESKVWELDIFSGRHEGLILAEVELTAANESIKIPDWIAKEVSDNEKYYNANLAFKEWSK